MPVLVALILVSLMGGMTLTNSMFTRMALKTVVTRINMQEGFYSAEVAAWTNKNQTGKDNTPLTFENDYLKDAVVGQNLSGLGAPMNVAQTSQFDLVTGGPARSIVRRYEQATPNIAFRVPSSLPTDACGKMSLGGPNSQRVCLSAVASAGPPPSPKPPPPNTTCSQNLPYASPGVPIASLADFGKVVSGTMAMGNFYYLTNDIVADGNQGATLPIVKGPLSFAAIDGNGKTITVKNFTTTMSRVFPVTGTVIVDPVTFEQMSYNGVIYKNFKFDFQSPFIAVTGGQEGVVTLENISVFSSTGMFWPNVSLVEMGMSQAAPPFSRTGTIFWGSTRGIGCCGGPKFIPPNTSSIQFHNTYGPPFTGMVPELGLLNAPICFY